MLLSTRFFISFNEELDLFAIMAQAKLHSQEETSSTLNDKEKEADEKEGTVLK